MLEEAGIEVLLESVLELDSGRLPRDVVRELYGHARLKLDLALARQVHVHDAVEIVTNLELLVRPQPVRVVLFVVLAYDAPDWQVVDVHLVPVVVLDRVREQLVLFFV